MEAHSPDRRPDLDLRRRNQAAEALRICVDEPAVDASGDPQDQDAEDARAADRRSHA